MAVLLALIAAIAIASICQAAPVSDPHHTLYRHSASGPQSNNRQSQFEVNLPFLRVSGQHNYPYGYHPVQAIVPFQPQQQEQRWLPSRLPFSGFNPATAIPPLCLPCSNTTWPFANKRSPQNRLFFPSFSINGAGTNTNNQGSSSPMDWMNWWTNPFGFLFPQTQVPQLPTLPYWTNIFCCNSTNNTSTTTTTTTTTATPPTTVFPSTTTPAAPSTTTSPTTTVIPPFPTIFPPTTTTAVPPTTTLIPPTTTTLIPPTTTTLIPPTTTTLIPPTTTLVPPTTTTLIPPTTTPLIPPTTTTLIPPTTTTLIPPTTTTLVPPTTTTAIPPTTTTLVPPTTTTTLVPPTTTTTLVPPTTTTAIPPPTTTPPPERSFESGTNKESLPTDAIPLSGLKLLMNLFPPSYISFVRR